MPNLNLEFFRNHKRWLIVGLLFLLSVINYLDRQTLSVLAPVLREQLGFTTEQYSYVVSAFLAAYTAGFGVGGFVLDRFGSRIGLAVAVSFWSLAGMLHALAKGWQSLAVLRFLLGLGESLGPPGGAKAIGEWAPRRERALSMAIFSNGMITGAVVAPPLVTFLAMRFGWRWAFVLTGSLGFLWLVSWLLFYHPPERHPSLTVSERAHILSERQAVGGAVSFREVACNPACYGLIVARFLTDPVPYFFTFWLPEYLRRERDFTMALIGALGWIPFLAADAGGLSGGAVSDWLVRRGADPATARTRVLLIAACLTPASAIAVRASDSWLVLALIGLVLAAHSCWIVNLLTFMTERFPKNHVATVVGLSGVGGGLGGILATLITGRVISSYGYVPVFSGLACLHLTAFGVLRAITRRESPLR